MSKLTKFKYIPPDWDQVPHWERNLYCRKDSEWQTFSWLWKTTRKASSRMSDHFCDCKVIADLGELHQLLLEKGCLKDSAEPVFTDFGHFYGLYLKWLYPDSSVVGPNELPASLKHMASWGQGSWMNIETPQGMSENWLRKIMTILSSPIHCRWLLWQESYLGLPHASASVEHIERLKP